MRVLAALTLALATPFAAAASTPSETTAPSERMAPFANLAGEWSGSGWMMMPDGSRAAFSSRETVTPRLSGAALLVEGHHVDPASGRVVHEAMAMLTWDARANAYRFRTALANGQGGDFPLTANANGFTWTIDSPAGNMEYVSTVSADRWHETGTLTLASGERRQIFEMTLTRQ